MNTQVSSDMMKYLTTDSGYVINFCAHVVFKITQPTVDLANIVSVVPPTRLSDIGDTWQDAGISRSETSKSVSTIAMSSALLEIFKYRM